MQSLLRLLSSNGYGYIDYDHFSKTLLKNEVFLWKATSILKEQPRYKSLYSLPFDQICCQLDLEKYFGCINTELKPEDVEKYIKFRV